MLDLVCGILMVCLLIAHAIRGWNNNDLMKWYSLFTSVAIGYCGARFFILALGY